MPHASSLITLPGFAAQRTKQRLAAASSKLVEHKHSANTEIEDELPGLAWRSLGSSESAETGAALATPARKGGGLMCRAAFSPAEMRYHMGG